MSRNQDRYSVEKKVLFGQKSEQEEEREKKLCGVKKLPQVFES